MSWPALAPWQWALGALCAFLIGVAKTGVPGVGILVVTLMVYVIGEARASAGWLLPILCVADVLAVVYYRRHAEARRLFKLAPWVLVGMAAGAATLGLPESALRRIVGTIIIVMIAVQLRRRARAAAAAHVNGGADARPAPGAPALYGVATGFATTVANAAGPVMNVYLLSQRLPKEAFVATGAWFFLAINLSKLPIYGAHGLISARSLLFDVALIPAVMTGALSGRALLRIIPQRAFEVAVLSLAAAAAALMLLPR
jgi:hypothetical protein